MSLLDQSSLTRDLDYVTIESIELYQVYIPFVQIYSTAMGNVAGQTNVVCKIVTNNPNIYGYGEACPLPPKFTTESVESVWKITLNNIFPLIKDLKLYSNDNYESFDKMNNLIDNTITDDNIMAKGMINMSLWDIYGKLLNMPVYKCLAQRYTNGEIYMNNNNGIPLLYPFGDQSIENDLNMIEHKWSQGYRTFMLKMGSNKDINYQIERVKAVNNSEYGPIGGNNNNNNRDILHIVCDANQGFTYDESLKFINGIGENNIKIGFFEQPINKYEFEKLKKLKNECIKNGFNLSLDESVQSLNAAKYCIDNEIGNILSVKVSKNGGISNLMKLVLLTQEKEKEKENKNDIKCLFNSMLEFGISQASLLAVAAVTKNKVNMGHCFMSTLRFKDDFTNFSKIFIDNKNKIVNVIDKPGLGITIDQKKLEMLSSKITICKNAYFSKL